MGLEGWTFTERQAAPCESVVMFKGGVSARDIEKFLKKCDPDVISGSLKFNGKFQAVQRGGFKVVYKMEVAKAMPDEDRDLDSPTYGKTILRKYQTNVDLVVSFKETSKGIEVDAKLYYPGSWNSNL